MENLRSVYQNRLGIYGDSSCLTLQSGLKLAKYLGIAHNHIEAERIVTKLASISRLVHGSEHHVTREANNLFERSQIRLVGHICKPGYSFHVQQYDEDTKCYTVTGPITDPTGPRNFEDERVMAIPVELVVPTLGCPVVCHGLQKASHLNGKIGDARDFDFKAGRYVVHFEDKSLKPFLVKPENLRILVDLPDE